MYRAYIDKCMPSVMIRTYLQTTELTYWQIVNLIMYSPVSIYVKLEELRKVYEDAKKRQDEALAHESHIAIKNIEEAISFIEADGVFSVEKSGFDDERKDTESYLGTICASMENIKEYIREDLDLGKIESEELRWYDICKWVKDANGKYVEACRYIIARDEIIYSEVDSDVSELQHTDIYNIYDIENLNVPVPFRAGDLLEFNGYPFGPKCHVLILDIGDNRDCCSVQGLALDDNGRWTCGAVKHGMVSLQYTPKISYLYSAKPYEGALEEDEQVLLKIRDYIGNNEEKGREIYDILWADHLTDEELKDKIWNAR